MAGDGVSFQTKRALKAIDDEVQGKAPGQPAAAAGEPAKGQVGTTVRPGGDEKAIQALMASGRAKNRSEAAAMVVVTPPRPLPEPLSPGAGRPRCRSPRWPCRRC